MPVPVSVNMIRHGSRIYLSTDFFKILGYNVNFNPLTFELVYTPIRRIWFNCIGSVFFHIMHTIIILG